MAILLKWEVGFVGSGVCGVCGKWGYQKCSSIFFVNFHAYKNTSLGFSQVAYWGGGGGGHRDSLNLNNYWVPLS